MIIITEMDAGGSKREQVFRVRSSKAKLLDKYLVQHSNSHVLSAYTMRGGPRERGNGTPGDVHTTKEHGDLTPQQLQQIDVFFCSFSQPTQIPAPLPFMPNIALKAIFWGQLIKAHL